MKHVEIKLTCLFDGLVRTRHIETYLPKSEYVGFDGDVFRIGQMFTVERWRVLKVQSNRSWCNRKGETTK